MDNAVAKRRRQLPEYKDLFKALFKIPDFDVQNRVLVAINGIIKDSCECLCCKKDTAEIGTQTDWVSPVRIKTENEPHIQKEAAVKNISSSFGGEVKRRRRTRKIPRVEKSSDEPPMPYLSQPKRPNLSTQTNTIPNKRTHEPILEFPDTVSKMNQEVPEPPELVLEKPMLVERMKKEYLLSMVYDDDGFMPIHKYIWENDFHSLKLQFYVLEKRNVNICELLTAKKESPLNLAIKRDSSTSIISELLTKYSNLEEVDQDGNTILHLAMQYTENVNVLELLLKKVDLGMLLKVNDDGLSCLHVGVKENSFFMCKHLLEFLDRKLGIVTVGDGVQDKKLLMKIYMRELNNFILKEPKPLNMKKMTIVNKVDVKKRWTPLFYAVSLDLTLMSFMLLCHLADPTIAEFSGTDCVTYADNIDSINVLIKNGLRNTAFYVERCNI